MPFINLEHNSPAAMQQVAHSVCSKPRASRCRSSLAQANCARMRPATIDQAARMANTDADDSGSPLLSNGLLLKITAFIGLLAVLTAVLTVTGKYYGDRLAMDEHTLSRESFRIAIGQDSVSFPANMIRFERQRHTGPAETLSIYLTWPELDGYTAAADGRFSDPGGAQDLLFLEFSQSVMSRDMAGRLGPIYSRLFRGQPDQGPAGLLIHHLDPRSGYGNEVILTGMTSRGAPYVARCLLPPRPELATTADCQRDMHVGRDLTLLYRYSSRLLPQWEALDSPLATFARRHIQP